MLTREINETKKKHAHTYTHAQRKKKRGQNCNREKVRHGYVGPRLILRAMNIVLTADAEGGGAGIRGRGGEGEKLNYFSIRIKFPLANVFASDSAKRYAFDLEARGLSGVTGAD